MKLISFQHGLKIRNKTCNNQTKSLCSSRILSTQDNPTLLKRLKSVFKRTINWNKYQSKVSKERQNQYLDYLIDPSFQGVHRSFV